MKIIVSIKKQRLFLMQENGEIDREYPASTAFKGVGEQFGSFQTPRGKHLIRAKIGSGMPENTVFVRRRPTGEIWTPALSLEHPGRDWMLTRILWLSGCELGFNRLGSCDTMRRFIYIHGCPDNTDITIPNSHGCVRLQNADIIDLFDRVPCYTSVDIMDIAH